MSKNYTKESLSVDALQVDLANPRLPHSREFKDHKSVMEYLQDKEDVYEIAESIVSNGVFPSEPLIAIKEADGSYSAIEGNRRLVAMKLLADPSLAIKQVPKFKALALKADRTELDNLDVIVYKDRISAAPVLIKRHTNDPAKIKPWEMIMRAYYTSSFITAGRKLADVANELSIDVTILKDDLKLLQLYLLAKNLPFSKNIADKINDEKDFPLSNLERAIGNRAAVKLFKITFDDATDSYVIPYDKKEFLKPFIKLIEDIAEERFNSRTHNKADEIEAYFDGFDKKYVPDTTKVGTDSLSGVITFAGTLKTLDEIIIVAPPTTTAGGATTGGATGGGAAAAGSAGSGTAAGSATAGGGTTTGAGSTSGSSAGTGGATAGGTKPRVRKSVIYKDVVVKRNSTHQRINVIVTELKAIDVNKYKNAAGVLLRTLLDITTHEFIKSQGEDKIMEAEALGKLKPPNKLREFWTPDLKPMLTRIVTKKYGLPATTLSALSKYIGTPGAANILYILNEIVHNPDYAFTSQELLDIYDKLEPYFKEVL